LLAGVPSWNLAWGQRKVYPHRWFYVSRSLREDRHVEEIRQIARTAAEHGLNGMLLAAGLDRLDLQPPEYFTRLEQVQKLCQQLGIEIIPNIFSAGYGGSVVSHNRNLAAGLAVKDALFVAANGEARLAADPPVAFVNASLEEHAENRVRGYQLQDRPGEVSFVDTNVFRSGKASLRWENFGKDPGGQARLMQEITVRPQRCYRVSLWARTEKLEPAGSLRVQVLAQDGRALAPWDAQAPSTTDWRKFTLGFNSLGYDKVRIYAGVRGGRSGRLWLDDFQIEEAGLTNVVRRPGTPVKVRSEAGETVYEEGVDYAPIADPQLNFRFDHDGPPIRLLPGGRVKDGERLRVSWYHGISINRGQVTVCMSEPEVYEIWRKQAALMHQTLRPAKYVLSMDEIRVGGSCEACRRRGMTMAQILGECITRQAAMLREANPKTEVFIWSDMLDPNHNARANYYLVEGDYTGSWKYAPKDLVIVCWYYARRRESLAHFSGLGYRTLAGAYYDGDTLENPQGWLEALEGAPGALGIMYTTWENKYELLAGFGDLVSGRTPPGPL
jgi:hypothetical protein